MRLNELLIESKESWTKYLSLIGIDGKKFKKDDSHRYAFYMDEYKKASDVSDFEMNFLDDLKHDADRIKLESFEILWNGELDGEQYALIAEGTKIGFAQNTRGGIVRKAAKGALKFISNPVVAGMAAGYAIDAISKYQRNKRHTTSFFARDAKERTFYQGVVNDLMATGKYKKVKEKYAEGGYMWVLQKVGK